MSIVEAPARAIVRIVLIIVAVILVLYLIYLLRRPLTWLFVAIFLAVALSGPVNWLEPRVGRRGFAIAITYLGLLAVPILLGALLIPPIVNGGNDLVDNAPRYARDVTDFVERNDTLRNLNEDYQITEKLQQEAEKLPGKLGGAAGTLRDVGFGIVNSIFVSITVLVLTAFMLGGGRRWIRAALELQPPDRAERLERVLIRSARAVSGYVAGAIAQAAIAAVLAYLVLTILGVPFRAPLAVLIFFADLIPLVGATIGAVLVGIVTLFSDFPTATIVWAAWSIVYQQFENSVIQPRIQGRFTQVAPILVLVSVLFGATLLGVLGALVAIPVAASIQIAIREWWEYGRETQPSQGVEPAGPAAPPAAPST
jgi:predicted PurR-regulated permease PerM